MGLRARSSCLLGVRPERRLPPVSAGPRSGQGPGNRPDPRPANPQPAAGPLRFLTGYWRLVRQVAPFTFPPGARGNPGPLLERPVEGGGFGKADPLGDVVNAQFLMAQLVDSHSPPQ